jgi:hypothetical protein
MLRLPHQHCGTSRYSSKEKKSFRSSQEIAETRRMEEEKRHPVRRWRFPLLGIQSQQKRTGILFKDSVLKEEC